MYAMLNGSTVYSSLDCTSGYHHFALSAEAQKKPAVIIPIGKYEFKKLPFGMAQAPGTFSAANKCSIQ